MFLSKLDRTKQSLSRQIAQMRETAIKLGFSLDLSHAEEAIALIERQRKQLVAEIEETADNRTITLADGISGLSREKAAILDTLLAGRMFANKNQLVAFCGLDVCARRSGMWKGREHLSKRGNSVLRKALYATAWGLALQLRFPFEVCVARFGLVGAPPERPRNDLGGLNAPLGAYFAKTGQQFR